MATKVAAYWCKILSDEGDPLNAHFSPQGSEIVLASGGGGGRNSDYVEGLALLLQRLDESSITLNGAWVDSAVVQHLPRKKREILRKDECQLGPKQIQGLLTQRMRTIGRDPTAKATGGNQRKQIRIETGFNGTRDEFIALLRGTEVEGDRLPVETLNQATPDFVWQAVQLLAKATTWQPFGQSTDFDLLLGNGKRLSPKAVFGKALSLALGGKTIEPKHFSAGTGSACFRLLEAAGFRIVGKDEVVTPEVVSDEDDSVPQHGDKSWREGKARIVAHQKRERGDGLAQAKKAEFIKQHGRLWCQACGMTPSDEYGSSWADSCIEVHHAAVQVRDMPDDHETVLSDLECVCANCHRLIHRHIREGMPVSKFKRQLQVSANS